MFVRRKFLGNWEKWLRIRIITVPKCFLRLGKIPQKFLGKITEDVICAKKILKKCL